MSLIHCRGVTVTRSELVSRGARAAKALLARGASPGDPVAILLANGPAFLEVLSCVRHLQATRVLLPWPLAIEEFGRLLGELKVRAIVSHTSYLEAIQSALAPHPQVLVVHVDLPDQGNATRRDWPKGSRPLPPSWIRWVDLVAGSDGTLPSPLGAQHTVTLTSGSTGSPKIVRRPGAQRWAHWYRHSAADRPALTTSIVTAPLFNSGQFGVFSQAWAQGANLVILPTFEPEEFMAAVERHGVSHAYLIPAMFLKLLKLPPKVRSQYDLRSLNYVVHTGGPCARHVKAQMIEWWGPIFWEAYGCSETSLIAECSTAEWIARPGTVGRPHVSVSILDGNGLPVPIGTTGGIHVDLAELPEVSVNGEAVPSVSCGHRRWFMTRDAGYVDDDGYLYVTGRVDDLINVGGVKTYPVEVESAVLEHPAVVDSVAFSLPDPDLGARIGVIAQVVGDLIERQLEEFLRERLPLQKIPTRIWICRQALRNPSGKVNRNALRDSLVLPRNDTAQIG